MEVQIGTFTVHRHAYRYEQKFFQLGTCDISLYLHSAVDVVQLLIHGFRCQGPLQKLLRMLRLPLEALYFSRISSYADLFR